MFSFPFVISLLLLQFNFSYGQKEKEDYFIQLLKKSSLVMDEPERKEQCFFLVAREKRRGPVGLSDTRHPLDKLWTNSRHVQAPLSAHQLEGMARGLNQTQPAAEQQQREALLLWNRSDNITPLDHELLEGRDCALFIIEPLVPRGAWH